jgi:hypothetical protein
VATRRKTPEPAAKPSTPVDDILKDDKKASDGKGDNKAAEEPKKDS